ncbi:MAG: STAS domain-containing protein [Lentisphaerae bacterium]|nr:STAS domain-containing protein [Lentisphaerota bacterium]
MSEFNIQTATEDGICHIRLTGRLTFAMSQRFDAFIDTLALENLADIIIDLRKADYLDSTILGLVAKIARSFIARAHRKPTLLSSREDMNLLLESMGFDSAFEIRVSAAVTPFLLDDIPVPAEEAPTPETLLEAHKLLMDLDDRNIDRFSTAVETLEGTLERKKSG